METITAVFICCSRLSSLLQLVSYIYIRILYCTSPASSSSCLFPSLCVSIYVLPISQGSFSSCLFPLALFILKHDSNLSLASHAVFPVYFRLLLVSLFTSQFASPFAALPSSPALPLIPLQHLALSSPNHPLAFIPLTLPFSSPLRPFSFPPLHASHTSSPNHSYLPHSIFHLSPSPSLSLTHTRTRTKAHFVL